MNQFEALFLKTLTYPSLKVTKLNKHIFWYIQNCLTWKKETLCYYINICKIHSGWNNFKKYIVFCTSAVTYVILLHNFEVSQPLLIRISKKGRVSVHVCWSFPLGTTSAVPRWPPLQRVISDNVILKIECWRKVCIVVYMSFRFWLLDQVIYLKLIKK